MTDAQQPKFTNPMLEEAQFDDGIESPLRASDQLGHMKSKDVDEGHGVVVSSRKTKPRIVKIETAQGMQSLDMNSEYPLGSQEWYLRERRLVHEEHGRYEVVETDGDGNPATPFIGAQICEGIWKTMTSGGNLAAGVASALHVNIYLLAIGLLLSSPYMGIMTIVRLAVRNTCTYGSTYTDSSTSCFSVRTIARLHCEEARAFACR